MRLFFEVHQCGETVFSVHYVMLSDSEASQRVVNTGCFALLTMPGKHNRSAHIQIILCGELLWRYHVHPQLRLTARLVQNTFLPAKPVAGHQRGVNV